MTSSSWLDNQSEHALACAKYGDCIFDKVQEGALEVQNAWRKLAQPWNSLIDASVKGFLWMGRSDRKWLSQALFQPARNWPKGLSAEEKDLLELAKAVSDYAPVSMDRLLETKTTPENAEKTLKALQTYAKLFKKKIALPMWREYRQIAARAGEQIAPLCQSTYGEDCSSQEGLEMFHGDLERGYKLKVLEVDTATYRVLPKFLSWIES